MDKKDNEIKLDEKVTNLILERIDKDYKGNENKLKNIKVKGWIHRDLLKIRALLELTTGQRRKLGDIIEYLLLRHKESK